MGVWMCMTASAALTLPVGKFLSEPGEFGSQLRGEDEAFLLFVSHPHGLQDLCLRCLLLELLVHDAQEGGKVQLSTPTCRHIFTFTEPMQ